MKDFKFALLWCGVAKAPETLLLALGHLWRGFILFPKNNNVWKRKLILFR